MGNICENRLRATGSKQQTDMLAALVKKSFETENFEESYIESEDLYQVELYFDSTWRFPRMCFLKLVSSLPDIEGLYIRVASDEPATNYLEQSIFEDGKWNFESPQTTIKIHHIAKDVVYAAGAYITPFSYTNKEGKTIFSWMVTGFAESVFSDGVEIDVVDSAYTLEGLTPPENQEEIVTETIIKTLNAYGLSEMSDDRYRKYKDNAYKTLDVRKLNSISEAGTVTQVLSTLDEFLLDAPDFTQDAREIIVETFGRDRIDIFTSNIYPLVIGSCRANIWAIGEYEDIELKDHDELTRKPK